LSKGGRKTDADPNGGVIDASHCLDKTPIKTTIARTEPKTLSNNGEAAQHTTTICRSEAFDSVDSPLLVSKDTAETPDHSGEKTTSSGFMPEVEPLSGYQKATKPPIKVLKHEVRTPYKYLPLNEAAQEIRLLTILPGEFSSELQATLHIAAFNKYSSLEFEALSYTWGAAENPVDILIGKSGSIKVTQNLAVALPYLRHSNRPRIIWIDAICINQQDLAERSSQVKRMADIYSIASQVIIWLGPETPDTVLAMDSCKEISSHITVNWLLQSMSATSSEKHWVDRSMALPWNKEQVIAVCNLLKRGWFSRLWIWQEVLLTDSAIVKCGSHSIAWRSIQDTVFAIYKKPKAPHLKDNLPLSHQSLLYILCKTTKQTPIDDLFDYTKHSLCSDPRDRIFALFSLLPPSQKQLAIEPDYTRTTSQVYSDFVQHYIERRKSLQIWTTIEMSEQFSTNGRTSWVPNWNLPRMTNPLDSFQASGLSEASIFFGENGALRVHGCRVGIIDAIEPFQYKGSSTYDAKAVSLMRTVKSPAFQGFFGDKSRNLGSLSRVLLGGRYAEEFSPPNENFATLDEAEEWILNMLKHPTDGFEKFNFPLSYKTCLDISRHFCNYRSLFKCSDDKLGLAPKAARVGDIVVVLLGCRSPLILRPSDNGHYLMLGEAYCDSTMCGEGILGPLPENFEFVKKVNKGRFWLGVIDRKSDNFYAEDLRLSEIELPPGWGRHKHANEELDPKFENIDTGKETDRDPRLKVEELKKRGVPLEVFELE